MTASETMDHLARAMNDIEVIPASINLARGCVHHDVQGLTSENASLNRFCFMFHEWLRAAYKRFSASVVVTEPVVISSESMNDSRPVNLTDMITTRATS